VLPTAVPSRDLKSRPAPASLALALFAAAALVACGQAPAPTAPTAEWRLVALDGVPAATMFADVITNPAGFLVAGAAGPAGRQPVILRSVDGRAWTSEAIDSDFASPAALVSWGDRAVAMGGGESNRCAHPAALDTWSREADGTWAEAPFDPDFCLGAATTTLLIHDDRPFLVGAGSGDISYVMSSHDGLRWDVREQPFGGVFPVAAATDGSGVWVFGYTPDGRPAGLRSADGISFDAPSAIPVIGPEAAIQSAVAPGGKLVLVMTSGPDVGILRPDVVGGGWHAEPATGIRGDQIGRILVVGDRLVALGADENSVPLAWSSADGTDWSPIRLPAEAGAGAALTGIAVRDDVAVLVGQAIAPDGGSAMGAIWVGSSALLAP
jgi:hypothetical protein